MLKNKKYKIMLIKIENKSLMLTPENPYDEAKLMTIIRNALTLPVTKEEFEKKHRRSFGHKRTCPFCGKELKNLAGLNIHLAFKHRNKQTTEKILPSWVDENTRPLS
jgi:HSP90 family molecular chaperone